MPDKQKCVLVCDDEPIILDSFERAFSGQSEFALDTASTVKDALEKLAQMVYDLVILDMRIEHSNSGLQILREIRRLEVRSRSRGHPIKESLIAIMSGSVAIDAFIDEADSLDVFVYIKKPVNFSPDYVRRKLNQIGIALMPPHSAVEGV